MAVTARLLSKQLQASVFAYANMEADENQFHIRGDWAAEGSTIERGLAAELGGTVVIRFLPDGVSCEVDAAVPVHG